MNKMWSKIAIAMLAILILTPHALAITSGFGGSCSTGAASKSEFMSLQSSDSFTSQETLSFDSGVSMESTGKVGMESEDGWLNQYHDVASGNLYAATYAYMDNPGSYTYDYSKSASASAVKVSEKLTATDAANLLYGGFAYNQNDYAGVQTIGAADSINYKNDLSATASKLSASQSFGGKGCSLNAWSWAERGNKEYEALDQTAIEGGEGVQSFGPADAVNEVKLYADQYAWMTKADIKSYKSSATIGSSGATASQSTAITISTERVHLNGRAKKGITTGDLAHTPMPSQPSQTWAMANVWTDVYYNSEVTPAEGITYSATTKSTDKEQSASQTVGVKSADVIIKGAEAYDWDGDGGYCAYGFAILDGCYTPGASEGSEGSDAKIPSSVTGSDFALTKENYATTSQSTDARGAEIYRIIEAAFYPLEEGAISDKPYSGAKAFTTLFGSYYDEATDTWLSRVPERSSRLNGKATATIDSKMTASLSGSWKVDLAKDMTAYPEGCENLESFIRGSSAALGYADANYFVDNPSLTKAKSFSFKEKAKATESSVEAA